jgi:hypothetical protein
MTATNDDEIKPMEGPVQPHLSKQDISKLDLTKVTALTPEVVSYLSSLRVDAERQRVLHTRV